MIETKPSESIVGAVEFYDALAREYDTMTGFEKRFKKEKPFFRVIVDKYKIASALDAGCGTGFLSLLLAQMGVRVAAVDLSQKMLARLQKHARAQGLRIETIRARFDELRSEATGAFNGIFCMGNSLAHLLTEQELRSTIATFHSLLAPGGVFFSQALNYDRILRLRPEIMNVTKAGQKNYVRSYEYNGDLITFHISSRANNDPQNSTHLRTTLRPVRHDELVSIIRETGFASVKSFGGISLEPFDRIESRDLVILAQK